MKNTSPLLYFTIASAVGSNFCEIAHAQSSSASNGQLDEIIVTSRKTSETLQTTPVAVTAINTAELERRQVYQLADLQRSTPNLSIGGAGTGPASIVYLAIRGEAQNAPGSTSDPAVGIYVDGVYYGRPVIGNLGVLDLVSAEILRGPQGTLFGRNTTGGALNLTTQQPTNKFEGFVKAGVGNYDLHQVDAVVNIPLIDEVLAARFAVRYDERNGYAHNPITGKDLGDIDGESFARATVLWSPANLPLTLTITSDYTHYKDNGTIYASFVNPTHVVVPAGAFGAGSPAVTTADLLALGGVTNPTQYNGSKGKFYQSYGAPTTGNSQIDNLFNRNLAKGSAATLDIDFGPVELKSITAYRDSDTRNSSDIDGTPANIVGATGIFKQHQFSEELQLSGSVDQLDWITGLFYFDEGGHEVSVSQVLGVFGSPFNLSDASFRAKSTGVFGQLIYHLTDSLRATGGVRYTWDSREINRHGLTNIAADICAVGVNAGTAAGEDCNDPHSAHFKYPAWTAGLDYQVSDDLFVYAKTSGAALAGGFNTRLAPVGYDAFGPEKVKDIELGFKADLWDRKLRTNTALFYSWRNNIQNIVNELNNGQLTQYQRNAGKVEAYGAEFEGTLLPWDGMEITTAAAYLHTAYVKGSFEVNGLGGPVDRSGELVNQAPKWTASLGATQSFDSVWGRPSFHVDYSYVAARSFYQDTADPNNPGQSPTEYAEANRLGVLGGYGLFNAQVGLKIDEPEIDVSFWARNLTDAKYYQNMFNSWTGLGIVAEYQGTPRTFGMTVGYHW